MISGIVDNPVTRTIAGMVIAGSILFLIIMVLPDQPLTAGAKESIRWVFATLWKFDFMLPVAVLWKCFYLWIISEVVYLGAKLILLVGKKVTEAK